MTYKAHTVSEYQPLCILNYDRNEIRFFKSRFKETGKLRFQGLFLHEISCVNLSIFYPAISSVYNTLFLVRPICWFLMEPPAFLRLLSFHVSCQNLERELIPRIARSCGQTKFRVGGDYTSVDEYILQFGVAVIY